MGDLKQKILTMVKDDLEAIEAALADNLTPHLDLVHEIADNFESWPKTQVWIDTMSQTVISRWNQYVNKSIVFGMDAGGLSGFLNVMANEGEIPANGSQVDWIYTRPYYNIIIYGNNFTI